MTAFERQEAFARELEAWRRSQRFSGGNDQAKYATCPHCDLATRMIEHPPSAQLMLDPERQRDDLYFTCEWCNREIPALKEHPVRKPVESESGEDPLDHDNSGVQWRVA